MLKYLIDTDVISKRNAENGANIRRWLTQVDDNTLAISAITLFEISRGVQRKRDTGASELAGRLQDGLDRLKEGFAGRILDLDAAVAEAWGRLAGVEHKQWMDRGLIATATIHNLVLVTCNATDMKGRGAEVINPDRNRPGHWAPDGTELRSGSAAV
ncbi:MAG: PIN domain-containing protein [Microvirga sp.]